MSIEILTRHICQYCCGTKKITHSYKDSWKESPTYFILSLICGCWKPLFAKQANCWHCDGKGYVGSWKTLKQIQELEENESRS